MKRNKQYLIITLILNIGMLLLLVFNSEYRILILVLNLFNLAFMQYLIRNNEQIATEEFKTINGIIESILGESSQSSMPTEESQKIMYANLNRLAKKVGKMSDKKEEDEQTIHLLLNNITSPIIYIDIDGKIRYLNNFFLQKFNVRLKNFDLYENIDNKVLYHFIDDAFIKESSKVKTLDFKDHYYHAVAVPVKSNNKFVGILFIFHDITDIKKYEKLQRHFLADASHELKTPLSAIKGSAEILLDRDHPKDTLIEFLNIIKSENERMEKIVNDILLISRLESDNLKLNLEEISLRELILDVLKLTQIHATKKNQVIMDEIGDDLFINGDYGWLKQAFQNLIMNAINYTDHNKTIVLKGYKTSTDIIFQIIDEGIGISDKDLPHIFERFYRVDRARSRVTGGTGLGLSIVKSVFDIHHVKIEVESTEGVGTTFTLKFNIKK